MRAFACPRCHQLVFFENAACLRCGAGLGLDPERRDMVLVADGAEPPSASASASAGDGGRQPGCRCANRTLSSCNWVVARPEPGALCASCRLTRTRPDDADLDGDAEVAQRFVRAESAKRRLVFQLLELDLPIVSYHDDPESGLAFDLLVRKAVPITIGHDNGVITIDLAESDDAYRERMRVQLGEPYRTMLGHLRHEVGHYYWDALVSPRPDFVDRFRPLFGDERADYQQALERHYAEGPPAGWEDDHVSAYAAAHPWEDWAESWAHYLHIRDSLQTAAWYGVIVTGPRVKPRLEPSLMAAPTPGSQDSDNFSEFFADWLPLTYALNAINRSMGKGDLYPFVLGPKVIDKLKFAHHCVLVGRAIPSR